MNSLQLAALDRWLTTEPDWYDEDDTDEDTHPDDWEFDDEDYEPDPDQFREFPTRPDIED